VESARPNLKLFLAKIVVMSLNDATFMSAVKKSSPTKQAAEELIKALNADRKAVLKLNGAEALKSRIEQSLKTDAETLRLASERLKAAAEKIKKASQSTTGEVWGFTDLRVTRVGFIETPPYVAERASVRAQDPVLTGLAILAGMAIAVVIAEAAVFVLELFLFKAQEDDGSNCVEDAARKFEECQNAANLSPFPLNIVAVAICDATLLADQATCLLP